MDSVYIVEQVIGPKGIIHLEHSDRWDCSALEMLNVIFLVISVNRSIGVSSMITWRKAVLSLGVLRIKLITFARAERSGGKNYVEEFDRRLAFKGF